MKPLFQIDLNKQKKVAPEEQQSKVLRTVLRKTEKTVSI